MGIRCTLIDMLWSLVIFKNHLIAIAVIKYLVYFVGLAFLIAVYIVITTETQKLSINEGENLELNCSTSLLYPVNWLLELNEIYFGGEISKSFKDMFLLTGNQSLGEYNLYISSADGRYAGNYTCIDDEGLGEVLRSFQLNIIGEFYIT